ncbi:LysM peptidoglycan-binding domain-containing protein, partial [Aquibium carbonis]|uniref:LysM peptidoglycan-binding domain-containing protein n=1 Tax=Aquibium carbonis TaxID=2495581 RepID=UPI001478D589
AAAASEPAPQPAEAQPETPAVAEQPNTDAAAPQVAASERAAQPTAEKPAAPAEQIVAAAPASTQPTAGQADSDMAADDDGIVTVTASPLQSVDSAVIIRRGDTLWRISRRVYGRGVRYSTLYLANQEQIEDPDRIWPGQVFRVPDKTNEGETADLDPIRAQVTTIDPAATAQ